jgi:molybdopterin converting factor small subunit
MQDLDNQPNVITARVLYQGLLHRIVGKPEETLTLPRVMDLGGLLSLLAQRYGPEFERAVITPEGTLQSGIGIFVNGLNPVRQGGLDYPLGETDSLTIEIALLGPPLSGG